jgi:hypothetical protein
MDDTSFSLRHNAKRAADRMIETGSAPSIDYGVHARDDGRFEIVWRTGDSPTTAEIEDEIAAGVADAETPEADPEHEAESEDASEAEPIAGENPWPPGTPVKIRAGRNRRLTGTIVDRIDATNWRVQLDFAAEGTTSTYEGADFEAAMASKPWAGHQKKAQHTPATPAKRPKPTELDAAAARGIMPEKPIVTSKANPHYQKRFDRLAELAAAGDWKGVLAYEVKGINSYAKMVKQYRDRLLAAHAASATEEAA